MPSYPPALFQSTDEATALQLAAEIRFATVAFAGDPVPDVIFAPFSLQQNDQNQPELIGHLLRTNPLYLKALEGAVPVRLIFNVADGYLTPSVYAEKPVSGKVVPTWNYVAAQITGELSIIPEEEMKTHLGKQVIDYEQMVGSEWKLEDAPDDYLAKMMRMIAAIRVTPTSFLVNKKLSQNKGGERPAINTWFDAPDPRRRRIADWFYSLDE